MAIMSAAKATGLVGGTEDQRVIRHTIGLGLEQGGGVSQHIEAGPHDLRLAAQAIRILHPFIVFEVRCADGAAFEQPSQGLSRSNLALMPAQAVDAVIKRRIRSFGGIGG